MIDYGDLDGWDEWLDKNVPITLSEDDEELQKHYDPLYTYKPKPLKCECGKDAAGDDGLHSYYCPLYKK